MAEVCYPTFNCCENEQQRRKIKLRSDGGILKPQVRCCDSDLIINHENDFLTFIQNGSLRKCRPSWCFRIRGWYERLVNNIVPDICSSCNANGFLGTENKEYFGEIRCVDTFASYTVPPPSLYQVTAYWSRLENLPSCNAVKGAEVIITASQAHGDPNLETPGIEFRFLLTSPNPPFTEAPPLGWNRYFSFGVSIGDIVGPKCNVKAEDISVECPSAPDPDIVPESWCYWCRDADGNSLRTDLW